ncbi:MAG: dehydrogenase [Balneolales bacterium]|nr:dehydrogenase [Balneolales bacterium]
MNTNNLFSDPVKASELYFNLCLPRRIEEKMLKLLRQNKISKWFSGIGQEAISVSVARAMHPEDYILTMHRNLGVFTGRNVPLYPLFCQLLGKKDGFSEGRERSFHFGIPQHRIIGMISHLAAMLPVADGLALSGKLRNEPFAVLAFCGEGATSEGDFHEALNLAAVWDLPVIFLVENNGYALSTPVKEQFRCKNLADRAAGYGMKGIQIDGNCVETVYQTISEARKYALENSAPVLVEAMTFRMRGHEEASGTAYVPPHLFDEWSRKDPLLRFEQKAIESNLMSEADFEKIRAEADASFLPELERALQAEQPAFDERTELERIFVSVDFSKDVVKTAVEESAKSILEYKDKGIRFIDAIRLCLLDCMRADNDIILIGQDISDYGGVFKITDGFVDEFGRERIRNTPIIESGALGAALGLAYEGFKPVVEMQFADFISCGFNQIINNIAKSRYRWSDGVNITIRAPHGAGVGAGPFHSQSPEGWFMQHPGLKIVVPSTVEDARNLLLSSIYDPNPVLFFEHKKLYRSLKESLQSPMMPEPLGKAKIRRDGTDASIISFGMGVIWATELANKLFYEEGINIEVLDLRTLQPLDTEAIKQTTTKTGRVLVLEEATSVLGPASEIASWVAENCFSSLDAPVMRCSSLHTPVPLNKHLEEGFLASGRLEKKVRELLSY